MSKLVWVDVETTGLDPAKIHLLELGMVVTQGPRLEIVDAYSWVIQAPPDAFEGAHEKVITMHSNNGLMAECYGKDAFPLAFAQRDALGWLAKHRAEKSAMCGSSVHFDRSVLKVHMAELESKFHYRNLDASSLKIMAELNGAKLPERSSETHRALADCFASIELAKIAFAYGLGWQACKMHADALVQLIPDEGTIKERARELQIIADSYVG